MIARLLLLLGLAVIDLDLVARALASNILHTHDVDVLDSDGTIRELRRRYTMVAIETGLPIAAQRKVADMAWRYIAEAQTEPGEVNRKEFSFYG